MHSYEENGMMCIWYKFNSHLTCFQRGLTGHLVEHRTGIAEVMGSNPVGASESFLGSICNCLSYFITARITFTSIIEFLTVVTSSGLRTKFA